MTMSKWVWPAARCNQHKVTFLLHLGLDQPTECTSISFTVLQGFLPLTLPCPYFSYGKAQEACSVPTWVPWLEEATMSPLESFTDVAFFAADLAGFPHRFTASVLFGWHWSVRKCLHAHSPCTRTLAVQEGCNIVITVKWVNDTLPELQLPAFTL